METKEAYRKKTEAKLEEWEAKLAELKARVKSKEASAALEIERRRRELADTLEDIRSKSQGLHEAALDRWSEIQKSIDHGLDRLKRAYEEISGDQD